MGSKYLKDWGDTYDRANVVLSKDINGTSKTDRTTGKALKELIDEAQDVAAWVVALGALDKVNLEPPAVEVDKFETALEKVGKERDKLARSIDGGLKAKCFLKDKPATRGRRLPSPGCRSRRRARP
ncbi:hypothetical protein [Pelomonas sp. KK5]|uniref:hypothetical protein n=1 Tax=Pelomonas sp. KK5 TaxID=1855730 RepID=UPI00117EF90C|nr:hypothetical protein [Pelomonas sp. KK5]